MGFGEVRGIRNALAAITALRKRRPLVAILQVAGLAVAAWLAGCGTAALLTYSPRDPDGEVPPIPGSPIRHVIVIMQENRTFDNLFHGYPGADTAQSGMSNGVEVPLTPVSLAELQNLDNSHPGWWQDWDNGKMDGFARASYNPPTLAYSYVPEQEVEQYWTMARQYVLGDRMFQSNTGPSFPAHQYMIAAQSALVVDNPDSEQWGCDAPPGSTAAVLGPYGTELPGIFPCFDYSTTADLLDERGVTWRYYSPPSYDGIIYSISAYQAIRHIRYGADWTNDVITPQTQVLTDIQNGELAQVTWIIPDGAHSDHPGSGSLEGPDWVASIVNVVGQSKFWNSTAIFISWDDWGGLYDHVVPPKLDAMGPGFRVPLLVVSAYAKPGYISHNAHESSGFIAFIEHNFGLRSLDQRDAVSDDFADCFDYSKKPRSFAPIPTKVPIEVLIHEKPNGPPDTD